MSASQQSSPTPPQLDSSPKPQHDETLLGVVLLLALVAVSGWWVLSQQSDDFNPTRQANSARTQTNDVTTAPTTPSAPVSDRQATTAHQATKPSKSQVETRVAAVSKKPVVKSLITRDARPLASNLAPEYPRSALRAGDEGVVLVRAEVNAQGVPSEVRFARRSGSRDLDRAALTAVRAWRFQPAMQNGRAVASAVEVPIQFVAAN